MKNVSAILLATLAFVPPARAQSGPELPQSSPAAEVEQTVGLTEISVQNTSPGVKGRKIWGELVPYGKLWRTGANQNTMISFDKEVKIGPKTLAPGTYSLWTIPDEKSWTVIVNAKTDAWGNSGYEEARDVVRIEVQPTSVPKRERMAFIFSETMNDRTRLDLEWDELRVSIPIEVMTAQQVAKNIDDAVDGAWRPQALAARYLLDNGGDVKKAMSLVDASIDIKETWYNQWIRAQLFAKMGNSRQAIKAAQRAHKLGDDSNAFEFYGPQMKEAVARWKSGA